MRKLLLLLTFSTLLLGAASTTYAQLSAGVRMGEPPPPRAYRVPPQPGPDYEWVEGYWYPQGSRYVWHEGDRTRPPYDGVYWAAPYYSQGRYFAGHWEGRQGQVDHNHQWDGSQQRDGQPYAQPSDQRAPNAGYQGGGPGDPRSRYPNDAQRTGRDAGTGQPSDTQRTGRDPRTGQPSNTQGGGQPNGRGNSNGAPQPTSSTIAVSGNQAWTATNISVTQGQVLKFQSSGVVQFSPDPRDKAGPGGAPNRHTVAGAPLPAAPGGSLLMRVDNGQPLSLGAQTAAQMPATGMLFLGINDDNVSDNTGQFSVTIMR